MGRGGRKMERGREGWSEIGTLPVQWPTIDSTNMRALSSV